MEAKIRTGAAGAEVLIREHNEPRLFVAVPKPLSSLRRQFARMVF